MKNKTLVLIILIAAIFSPVFAEDLDYQAILELNGSELKEQSIAKGEEFIKEEDKQKQEPSHTISIKNEFPESIKLLLEDESGENPLELYLNAYEDVTEFEIKDQSNYTVRVYNVHGRELGKLRESSISKKSIKVSPFLLVKNYSFKRPSTKAIEKSKIIFEEKAEQPKKEPEQLKEQKIEIKPISKTNEKRSIKVANISDRSVHIDISEPGGKAIGSGWTIHNDIYEAQFLNFESEPVQLSSNAELKLTAKNIEPIIQKAQDLSIDERGNFTWLIEDLE